MKEPKKYKSYSDCWTIVKRNICDIDDVAEKAELLEAMEQVEEAVYRLEDLAQ